MNVALVALGLAALLSQGTIFDEDSGTNMASGAIAGMEAALEEAAGTEGAVIAVGIMDLGTGERITAGESRPVQFGNPELVVATCAVDLLIQGEISLDDIPGGGETIAYLLGETMKGRADPGIILHYFIGDARFQAWLSETGMSDTEYTSFRVHFPGAPEVEPSLTSADDCLSMLQILSKGIDVTRIRRALHGGFPQGPDVLSSPDNVIVYGVSTYEEDGESVAAIAVLPDGSRIGLIAIAEDPNSQGIADQAFATVWVELMERQGL